VTCLHPRGGGKFAKKNAWFRDCASTKVRVSARVETAGGGDAGLKSHQVPVPVTAPYSRARTCRLVLARG